MDQLSLYTLSSYCFGSPAALERRRMMVHSEEILTFWQEMSLVEKERLVYFHNTTLLSYISQNICFFISNRNFKDWYPSYRVRQGQESLLSIYDCIVFRVIGMEKEERELISSFLLLIKETPKPITTKINEVISNKILTQSIIKVKGSYIIRIVSFLQKYVPGFFEGERIVLEDKDYDQFIYVWINRRGYKDVSDMIRDLFLLMLVLAENQIVRAFVGLLSPQEKERRKYFEPVKIIREPKLKSLATETMREDLFDLVEWDQLRVEAFRIKFRVEKRGHEFLCYRMYDEIDSEEEDEALSWEDRGIRDAFKLQRLRQQYH